MPTIDHLGIAVKSIAQARRFYESLGLNISHLEDVQHEGVRTAMIPIGDSRIELLEPLAEDTVVGKFLARRGAGLHHIAIHVDNIAGTFEHMQETGVRLVSGGIQVGAGGHSYFFIHPSSASGMLVEICQDPASPEIAGDV